MEAQTTIKSAPIPLLVFTYLEAAQVLKSSTDTIKKLIAEGKLRQVRLGERKAVIPVSEINRFLKNQLEESEREAVPA